MSFVNSPNMNLPVPSVGSESGPQYAFDINNCMSLIDSHDHSPGRGVMITPAGFNINTALPFNNNPATLLSYLSLVAGTTASTVAQSISVAPVSTINELFYTDSNGTQTQITKNGQVNVIASSIPGESYASGTFIWTQTQSSLPTTPANFDIGSVTIRPNTAGTTNGVTLGPPGSISSAYNITLPLLPVTTNFMAISSSGIISTPLPIAGSNFQYLRTIAGVATWTAPTSPTFQRFTSGSGTYTLPTGPTPIYLKVTILGGGGGGGASGTGTLTAPTSGGNTLFGVLAANGGGAGTNGTGAAPGSGGSGGIASNTAGTLISVTGTAADQIASSAVGNTATLLPGSSGGSSAIGGGGRGGLTGIILNGAAGATNSGSGGGGSAGVSTISYPGAGGGAGGYVIAVITSPSGTYTYQVGTAGAAGTGSGGIPVGGAGAAGLIVVEEFYQ